MSNTKCYGIVTNSLLQLQKTIDENDKKTFSKLIKHDFLKISNCSCGDFYLQQAVQKVYIQAIEKFILN